MCHPIVDEARVRGGILPSTLATSASSTPGGGGMLLHWKKEKMLESKAEEEAEKEQQQYGRRRYYTASAEGTPSVRTAAVAEVAAPTSLMIPGVPVVADEQPLKRKRCASECHPPVSVAPEFSPTVVVESNNPPPIGKGPQSCLFLNVHVVVQQLLSSNERLRDGQKNGRLGGWLAG